VCELRFRAEFEETSFTANYRDVCQLVMQGAELWLVCFAGETWHATVLMSAGRETLTYAITCLTSVRMFPAVAHAVKTSQRICNGG
jgi:hypothetical protein